MTRLVEYLFSDLGVPTPDAGDNSHMGYGDPGEDGMATRNEGPVEYGYGNPLAYLDGQPISFHSRHDIANREHDRTTYDEQEAIRYRGVLSSPWESVDEATDSYAAFARAHQQAGTKSNPNFPKYISHGIFNDAATARKAGPIVRKVGGVIGVDSIGAWGRTSHYQAIQRWAKLGIRVDGLTNTLPGTPVANESDPGHSVQDPLDEALKKGKNEPSAGDTRAIKSLTDGKYPAKSEDGKGFCFQWADGRGIVAFKWRNDALRWAKTEPRDIVKFWYGEPVHSNGKFRIRVTDRYRKEEAVGAQTFSELLLERLTL